MAVFQNVQKMMGSGTKPLIKSIMDRLSQAKLRADATILQIFTNLQVALDEPSPQEENDSNENNNDTSSYDTTKLIDEILNKSH